MGISYFSNECVVDSEFILGLDRLCLHSVILKWQDIHSFCFPLEKKNETGLVNNDKMTKLSLEEKQTEILTQKVGAFHSKAIRR